MIKKHFPILLFLLPLVILTLGGCAGMRAARSPEETLRARANTLIQAQRDNKWDIVYQLYDSSYKKAVPEQAFVNRRRSVVYGDYTIENIEIGPDGLTARIRIKSDITMQGMPFKDSASTQQWILEDGSWYHKVKTAKQLFTPTP